MTPTLSVKQANLILREAEKHLHLIQFRICEMRGEPPHGSPLRMEGETLDQCFTELSYVKSDYNEAVQVMRELIEKASQHAKLNSEGILRMAQDIGVPVQAVLVENVYQKAQAKVDPEPKALDWDALNRDLVLECERAIRQRDKCLETGVSTASHGGTHDTCFEAILRKHLRHFLR